MSDVAQATPAAQPSKPAEPETLGSFLWFVVKLVLAVLLFRSFLFAAFSIPSESMLPRLWNGDYLVASKWPYGFSRYSLPFNAPLISGRVLGHAPKRGDIVIFKHPIDKVDYIKRVIGLPGDTVEVRGGQVILNGKPLPRVKTGDFSIPQSANTTCAWGGVMSPAPNGTVCIYQRFRETLPSGVSYDTLDFGRTPQDDFPAVVVPEGAVFVMGDNRDNSQDSRFPAVSGGGVGMVPQVLLVGRAEFIAFSTDGSASWVLPWTWFSAARWNRIGDGL